MKLDYNSFNPAISRDYLEVNQLCENDNGRQTDRQTNVTNLNTPARSFCDQYIVFLHEATRRAVQPDRPMSESKESKSFLMKS